VFPNAQIVSLANALSCGYLFSGRYFLYKTHLALCLQICVFLKIDQLHLQICMNLLYVTFHWSNKKVKSNILFLKFFWWEPRTFKSFFSSRFQNVPWAVSKDDAGNIRPVVAHIFFMESSISVCSFKIKNYQNVF